ncbi:MAG: hypothetical protein K1X79_05510 [Oligoflexia bacterium]|nr:hypothetical protein [Oligoflexia bacterium]
MDPQLLVPNLPVPLSQEPAAGTPLEPGIPLAGTADQDVQLAMSALARSVRGQVADYSTNQLFAIAAGATESLDPKSQQAVAGSMLEVSSAISEARDITLSALTGSEVTGAKSIQDLSPEQLRAASENVGNILQSASDEQLLKLVAQLNLGEQNEPRTREQAIELLKNSDILSKSFSNGEVALTLAEVLRDSGKLPEVARDALAKSITEARQALERLKDIVALIIMRELLAQADDKSSTRREEQDTKTLPIWFPETSMDYRQVLEAILENEKNKEREPKNPWEEYAKQALEEQDRRLRESAEDEEEAVTAHDEYRRAALKAAIEQTLKANPGFANSIAGISIQQLSFLSEIGRPTPIFIEAGYQSDF